MMLIAIAADLLHGIDELPLGDQVTTDRALSCIGTFRSFSNWHMKVQNCLLDQLEITITIQINFHHKLITYFL